jgi:hypothetical protein
LGGSGSTGREAIEEKERMRKRWSGIESKFFQFKQIVPLLLTLVHSSAKGDFFRQCKG